jgi:dTDP-4-dehydrorhamnose reductase
MILLFGASGYIGRAFAAELDRRGLACQPVSRADVDFSSAASLQRMIDAQAPSFVINAAGFTGQPNVDACETNQADTILGNVMFPQMLAQACSMSDVPLGHVSSGCIYDGCLVQNAGEWTIERNLAGEPFRRRVADAPHTIRGFGETSVPNFSFRNSPCSFYSGTKALAEEWLANARAVYIWRLRIPFDELDGARNYLSKLQRYDRLYESFNSLTHRADFAQAAIDLWERRAPFGVYNMTNPGFVSTNEVTEMIGSILGGGKSFEFFADADEFYSRAAVAPRSNCILDTDKLAATGVVMRPVREALQAALESWAPESR